MIFATLHPGNFVFALVCLAGPAAACGVASGTATPVAVNARAEIQLDDGRWVRLAGLDIAAAEPARALLRKDWVGGKVVVDLIASQPDRWGRWPADLVRADGDTAATALLAQGFARVRPEFEARGCEAERLDAEGGARAAGQGSWERPGAAIDASNLGALRGNDGRFVLVEGKVRRVGVGRSRVYLDFGRRAGFTVVVEKKLAPAFERLGIALSALAGRSVRARGVLETRFGFRIAVFDPLMIEPIDAPKEAKPGG